jgi:hypothetical protein
MGQQSPGIVGIAVNFRHNTILQLAFDPTAGIALQAYGIEDVLRMAQIIRNIRASAIENGVSCGILFRRVRLGRLGKYVGDASATQHRSPRKELSSGVNL